MLKLIQQTAVGIVVFLTALVVFSIGYGLSGGQKACTPFDSIGGQFGVVAWVSAACVILVVLRYASVAVIHKVRGSKKSSSSKGGGNAAIMVHDGSSTARSPLSSTKPVQSKSQSQVPVSYESIA